MFFFIGRNTNINCTSQYEPCPFFFCWDVAVFTLVALLTSSLILLSIMEFIRFINVTGISAKILSTVFSSLFTIYLSPFIFLNKKTAELHSLIVLGYITSKVFAWVSYYLTHLWKQEFIIKSNNLLEFHHFKKIYNILNISNLYSNM